MCVYETADVVRGVIEVFRAVEIYQEVQTTKVQGKMEAKSLLEEAKTAKKQAAVERQEGVENARRQKLSSILNMAKEKTLFASNNIATTSQTVFLLSYELRFFSPFLSWLPITLGHSPY